MVSPGNVTEGPAPLLCTPNHQPPRQLSPHHPALQQQANVACFPSQSLRASANKYFDLTPEQFKATYMISDSKILDKLQANVGDTSNSGGSTKPALTGAGVGVGPTDVNWVTAGKVTPIRDQGGCGESLGSLNAVSCPSGFLAPLTHLSCLFLNRLLLGVCRHIRH